MDMMMRKFVFLRRGGEAFALRDYTTKRKVIYSKSKSFIKICRGSAPVPTPDQSGQPRGDCPYKNITIEIGLLYYAIIWQIYHLSQSNI